MSSIKQTFKVTLIGDGGVGKTTMVKRHRSGEFLNEHKGTLGVEVHPIRFNTNKGKVEFNMWDTAGQPQFSGLKGGYYKESHCCIAMFDKTNLASFYNLKNRIKYYNEFAPNTPIIIVGNKADCKHTQVPMKLIRETFPYVFEGKEDQQEDIHDMGNLVAYYDYSCKSNFEKPFIALLRELINPNIKIIDKQHIEPSQVYMPF